jgi:hypothetical protein
MNTELVIAIGATITIATLIVKKTKNKTDDKIVKVISDLFKKVTGK